ncbi:MAG: enoyl-CoA hydratase/isomerase family protein [Deltaproteobacteria bacterium]|nr:enoyl-CoA hydratase/isomerase family protein [Deltaproteobacteria bacterium]
MGYENILFEREEGFAVLTVNRPKVLNALNAQTLAEIDAAVGEVEGDAGVRALIITGAGDKAFVAGADINEIRDLPSPAAGVEMSRRGHAVYRRIEKLPKPVVVAINGFALGGGCELALAGDVRIAADTAKLGLPEINLGIFPGYGGTQRLPRLVGKGMAKLMIFSGEMIDAQEALRIGLVEKVVPAGELLSTARELASKLAAKAPVALAYAKRSVDDGFETDLDRGCGIEATNFGVICSTADKAEGTEAFLEKRKPRFRGE